jgi:hypothetical protein
MRLDIVIANPPYSVGSNHICEKIDNKIKTKKPIRFISCQPIYSTITYKTAEQIPNVFDMNTRSPNLFIMDMNGNINEYMSMKRMPYWSKTGNLRLYARWNYNFDIIDKTKTKFAERAGSDTIDENFPKDFLLWLQTNETAQFFRKTFFHICTKTRCINKLWEIYNSDYK